MKLYGTPPTRLLRALWLVNELGVECERIPLDERLTVADFNAAYTLDWARWAGMLGEAPRLQVLVDEMYARPKAPPTIAAAFEALRSEVDLAARA